MYCLYNLPVEPSNFVKQCRLCQGTRSRRYHSWLFASCTARSSSMGARRRCRCSSLVLHDGSGMEPNGGWWKMKLCRHIVFTASCPTMAKKQRSSNISVLFRNHVWHRHKSMNLCINLHQPFHLTTPT